MTAKVAKNSTPSQIRKISCTRNTDYSTRDFTGDIINYVIDTSDFTNEWYEDVNDGDLLQNKNTNLM